MTSLAQTILLEMDDLIRTILLQNIGMEYDEGKRLATIRLKEKYGDSENINPQH